MFDFESNARDLYDDLKTEVIEHQNEASKELGVFTIINNKSL